MREVNQKPSHPNTYTPGSFPELKEAKVLVVDDEDVIREFVLDTVGEEGAEVTRAETVSTARGIIGTNEFHVALIDAHLPDGSGLDLVARLREVSPRTASILITGFPDPRKAKKMEEVGVETLLTKPFTASQLLFTVYREFMRVKGIDRQSPDTESAGTGLVGNSGFIKKVRQEALLFARGDVPVLIQGPTGTGKEIIARAIHNHSTRRDRQMITINCAAIPDHLEESEFFGHVKGAFTGASAGKDGIVQCADNSTLFLDEVGELSLPVQAKLLRVLDVQEFTRVGDTRPQKVNVRFISATNKDLEDM
ncbi:MAG: response regulator, partial [Chitinivibrionales bacterium]|nr:response regulator [Chitinivibrionales bacterium]MBD3396711.1 response regulator [Chitinivibrionales bacterium]